ncbi:EspG family protein [Nocardia amikacinitolerans]|uniref:ESX secretion-associated protein EspG n=1 Tax=Nocardia amikacinitolerans TaxID=756689 RepID=UPI0020A362C2|nr:ESX secretion-associated protein EspG [Nocardia amikacinitolerans]MCP2316196.1 EspG family protein [Nocardia amikacinitolerans]
MDRSGVNWTLTPDQFAMAWERTDGDRIPYPLAVRLSARDSVERAAQLPALHAWCERTLDADLEAALRLLTRPTVRIEVFGEHRPTNRAAAPDGEQLTDTAEFAIGMSAGPSTAAYPDSAGDSASGRHGGAGSGGSSAEFTGTSGAEFGSTTEARFGGSMGAGFDGRSGTGSYRPSDAEFGGPFGIGSNGPSHTGSDRTSGAGFDRTSGAGFDRTSGAGFDRTYGAPATGAVRPVRVLGVASGNVAVVAAQRPGPTPDRGGDIRLFVGSPKSLPARVISMLPENPPGTAARLSSPLSRVKEDSRDLVTVPVSGPSAPARIRRLLASPRDGIGQIVVSVRRDEGLKPFGVLCWIDVAEDGRYAVRTGADVHIAPVNAETFAAHLRPMLAAAEKTTARSERW